MKEIARHRLKKLGPATLITVSVAAFSAIFILQRPTKVPCNDADLPQPDQAQSTVRFRAEDRTVALPEHRSAERAPAKVFDWRTVESADYRAYIANLRAIGCPEETIRDIILADVNKLFAERQRAKSGTNRFEYWKPGSAISRLINEEFVQEQAELTMDKRALLKELLGMEMADKPDLSGGMPAFEQVLDFLPADKWGQTLEVELLFAGRLASSIRDMLNGDFNSLKSSLAEKEAVLGQILTPEEKFEYDARLSYTAVSLQNRLGEFSPTEEEYRELVRLQKHYDDNFGPLSMAAAGRDLTQERAQAQRELETQTRALLGDERHREFRNEQAWMRGSFRNVAQEFGVPKQTAFQVFDITDMASQEAERIRADAMLSQSQKKAALDAVRGKTEAALAGLIGAPALEAYKKRSGTINNLSRLTN